MNRSPHGHCTDTSRIAAERTPTIPPAELPQKKILILPSSPTWRNEMEFYFGSWANFASNQVLET